MAGAQSSKVLAGDLDSSLANLVGNLGIAAQKKHVALLCFKHIQQALQYGPHKVAINPCHQL
ncbi:UNVERIFIED_CONTAM: hypothetical protein FKN15_005452 [Acipenser sinensis]